MKPIFNPVIIAKILVIVLFYVACSNLQEPHITLTLSDVEGMYKGILYVNQIEDFDTDHVDELAVESVVDRQIIYFSDFPVFTFIAAIEQKESLAVDLCENLIIPYEINFESKVIENQSRIRILPDPQPLNFSYSVKEGKETISKNVTVFYTTRIKTSGYSSGKLFISLIAEEVQVNNKPLFIFAEQYLSFKMIKSTGG